MRQAIVLLRVRVEPVRLKNRKVLEEFAKVARLRSWGEVDHLTEGIAHSEIEEKELRSHDLTFSDREMKARKVKAKKGVLQDREVIHHGLMIDSQLFSDSGVIYQLTALVGRDAKKVPKWVELSKKLLRAYLLFDVGERIRP